MQLTMLLPGTWTDWAAMAQLVQTAVIVFGLWLARKQVIEALLVRRQQALREVINELGSERVRRLRGWVLRVMGPAEQLNDQEIWDAQTVAVTLDRAAYMVHKKIVDLDVFTEFMGGVVEELWPKLRPVVKEVQKSRPKYCQHLERLATVYLPSGKV